jgi:hypothetical protein
MAELYYNDSELQMDSQLILCIEEYDSVKNPTSIDTRLFIGCSNGTSDEEYFIRGKRQDIHSMEFVPYAFHCDSLNELCNFIEFVIGKRKTSSVTLYNYNNVYGMEDHDLTYEFFEENMDRNYEIAAYDNVTLKRSELKKQLRILKSTYNWEN